VRCACPLQPAPLPGRPLYRADAPYTIALDPARVDETLVGAPSSWSSQLDCTHGPPPGLVFLATFQILI
jgi:hypothetical protein